MISKIHKTREILKFYSLSNYTVNLHGSCLAKHTHLSKQPPTLRIDLSPGVVNKGQRTRVRIV